MSDRDGSSESHNERADEAGAPRSGARQHDERVRRLPVVREPAPALDAELARGLRYVHQKLGDRIVGHHELAAHVYALTESLIAAGLLSLQDFEARKRTRTDQMMSAALTDWEGAEVLSDDADKYHFPETIIDCRDRIHLCKAACCRLDFFLSRQDLDEGIVRWDVGRPYAIAKREDGWCTHCAPDRGCEVHEHRPLICRGYDCRHDARIWVSFDDRVPSPELARL